MIADLKHPNDDPRVGEVVGLVFSYGSIDGSHHKTWLIDQIMRALLGEHYHDWREGWEMDDDCNKAYSWDEGCPP